MAVVARVGAPVAVTEVQRELPGSPAYTTVMTALLTALTADERRVLTAHELSHLTKRHHLHVHLTDIAAAANLLLNPVRAAVRLGVERWVDEDAAAGIGDRRITGRALTRVALLRSALVTRAPSPMTSTDSTNPLVPALGVGNLHVVLTIGVVSPGHLHEAIKAAAPLLHQAT